MEKVKELLQRLDIQWSTDLSGCLYLDVGHPDTPIWVLVDKEYKYRLGIYDADPTTSEPVAYLETPDVELFKWIIAGEPWKHYRRGN